MPGEATSAVKVSPIGVISQDMGEVGWWRFDEGSGIQVIDSSGMGNTGTLSLGTLGNTTPANAWVAGVSGGALSFDGVDDFVNVPHSTSLNITSAITLEAWVRITSTGPLNVDSFPIDKFGAYWLWQGWGDAMNFEVWVAGARRRILLGQMTGPTGWTHLVGTYDISDRTLRGYVNGVAVTPVVLSGLASFSIDTSSNPVRIHRSIGGRAGLIDEVRIYNRALSAAEVMANFNAGRR